MIDAAIEEAKTGLRTMAHKRRAAMHAGDRMTAARAAAAHFFEAVEMAPTEVFAGYWPIRDEIDCKPVLTRLVDAGQPVCLPVVTGDEEPLELRRWEIGAALYPAGFGTLAPAEDAEIVEPDVILMPLLGFDRSGTRLGYGGGYYDRTLSRLSRRPRLIGYAFACQEIDNIPRDPHDVPLDAVITEAGYRVFGAA